MIKLIYFFNSVKIQINFITIFYLIIIEII